LFCTDCPRHDANQNTCSLFLWRFVLALRAMAYVHAEVLTIAACDDVTVSPCHLKCPCRERCETTRPHEPPNFPDALGGSRKGLFGAHCPRGAPSRQRPSYGHPWRFTGHPGAGCGTACQTGPIGRERGISNGAARQPYCDRTTDEQPVRGTLRLVANHG
jgi:hypothetical protein